MKFAYRRNLALLDISSKRSEKLFELLFLNEYLFNCDCVCIRNIDLKVLEMSSKDSSVERVSEIIEDSTKRSFKEPFLLILAGIFILVGSAWQLSNIFDLMQFLPEELIPLLLSQAVEGFYVGILIGILLFLSSIVMYLVNQTIGAVVGLICSGLGFFIPGSGFLIGPIFGLIACFNVLMASKPVAVGDPNEVL